jgi:uncharacterized protein
VFANGRGSFTHVKRAIERALHIGVAPDLSITVTAQSAPKLADVVTYALDRDLRFNLNFYREHRFSAGCAGVAAEDAQLIAGVRAAFAVIESRLPRRRLIDGLIDRSTFDRPHEHACGAGHAYMVIDQRGTVSRCHMEIERPLTTLQAVDPLQAIRLERYGLRDLPGDARGGCRDCMWRYWCAGGCPVLTTRVYGRSDVRSPYCDVYRSLYPDVLRLEGLRLLKWAEQASGDQVAVTWV